MEKHINREYSMKMRSIFDAFLISWTAELQINVEFM